MRRVRVRPIAIAGIAVGLLLFGAGGVVVDTALILAGYGVFTVSFVAWVLDRGHLMADWRPYSWAGLRAKLALIGALAIVAFPGLIVYDLIAR